MSLQEPLGATGSGDSPAAVADAPKNARRKGPHPVLAAVTVLAVLGMLAYITMGNIGGRSAQPSVSPETLPERADGLVLVHTAAAQQKTASARAGAVKTSARLMTNVLVGAYGLSADGDYEVVVSYQPINHLSAGEAQTYASIGSQKFVADLTSKMTGVTTETSGDPTVTIACGNVTVSTGTVLTCGWADAHDFGLGYFYNDYATFTHGEAAALTDALRAAATQAVAG